ncbi:NACHT domain-containing protein [Nonomuraea sp. NPDC059194]|uniref:NACHT domain-containing protein n=1 Tax=Nonomuraea sp. NPDC059194 TaxID=3346764 RepID=UPI0036959160
MHRYVDALRLLGGPDPLIRKIDTATGAVFAFTPLVDAKNELIKVGNDLLGRWREWRSATDWRSRTERIEAAHTILVVTAFFEAVETLRLPEIIDYEKKRLVKGVSLDKPAPDLGSPLCPSGGRPYEETREVIHRYHLQLAKQLRRFLQGLAVWDEVGERFRAAALADLALDLYDDLYRRLAADVPEFALWAGVNEHQATRAGLADLSRMLLPLVSGAVPAQRLAALSALYREALRGPVAESGDAPIGVTLPSLEQAYLPHRFRAGVAGRGANPSWEGWWESIEVRTDLPAFLAGHLTGSAAARVPLMVLGQPGAGKSVLTKVLAAQLPERDFLPIRVPLREVSAGADLQEQIEQAIYQHSGERMEWPRLAESAGGALPVVILDGFDELLQATGVRQSDYLARAARFQQREHALGRAVAIIVTSRTAVADRTDYPDGTTVVRLEPFDREQIAAWLRVWNTTNAAHFTANGLASFDLELALFQQHLAEQPLLLLMLALYDADRNALRDHSARGLDLPQLYERLIGRFVERELEKSHPRDVVGGLVEQEIQRLSIVAFAMFNRGRQWATAEEADHDLRAMRFTAPHADSLAGSLSAGEQAFGRFFFVHRAQATQDGRVLQTYEFLHATFAEFLIARLVASLLRDMVGQQSGMVLREADDSLLATLLSWAVVAQRLPILAFLTVLLAGDRSRVSGLVIRLFERLDTRADTAATAYRPRVAGPARRYASYSANLALLALVCSPELPIGELMPGRQACEVEWRRYALLWRSQLDAVEWHALVRAIHAEPRNGMLRLDLSCEWEPDPVDSTQAWKRRPYLITNLLRQQIQFTDAPEEAVLLYALQDAGTDNVEAIRSTFKMLTLGEQEDPTELYQVASNQHIWIKAALGDLAMRPPQDAAELLEVLCAYEPVISHLVRASVLQVAARTERPRRPPE